MMPSLLDYAEAVHAWHEIMVARSKEDSNRVPFAARACVEWIDAHPMLPPVCAVDVSSGMVH